MERQNRVEKLYKDLDQKKKLAKNHMHRNSNEEKQMHRLKKMTLTIKSQKTWIKMC